MLAIDAPKTKEKTYSKFKLPKTYNTCFIDHYNVVKCVTSVGSLIEGGVYHLEG